MSDFLQIDSLFGEFLLILPCIFSDAEIAEVRQFVDVGEYGLALETAVDIVAEEGKISTTEIAEYVRKLANAMSLPPEEYLERLQVGSVSGPDIVRSIPPK